MEKHNNKEPKKPSAKNDRLENKDMKNTNKRAASQTAIGEHEFEENRSNEIRMKPQPFEKNKKPIEDHESDGL